MATQSDEFGSTFFVRLTSNLVAAAMIPLMLFLTFDVYIVTILIVQSVVLSATIAIFIFVVFTGLWFAYPLARRRRALSPGLR
jgi:hypothetical protein